MTAYRTGQRIRWARGDGPHGRVARRLRAGVMVRWDDGRTEWVHPEDITPESKVTDV